MIHKQKTAPIFLTLFVSTLIHCKRTPPVPPPQFLSEVPKNALAVMGFQWSSIRQTSVFRTLQSQLDALPQVQHSRALARTQCGFDLSDATQSFTLALLPSQGYVGRVRMTASQPQIEQCLSTFFGNAGQRALSELPPIQGHRILQLPQMSTLVSILPNGIVGGSPSGLTETFAAQTNPSQSAFAGTSLRAAYDSLQINPVVYVLIDTSIASPNNTNDSPTSAPWGRMNITDLQNVWLGARTIAYGVGITDQGAKLVFTMRFDTNAQAEQTRIRMSTSYRSSLGLARSQNLIPAMIEDFNTRRVISADQVSQLQRMLNSLLDRPRFTNQGNITRIETEVSTSEGTFLASLLASVAQQSFSRYIQQSQTAEATAQLSSIYHSLESYASAHQGQLPPSAPLTPANVPQGTQVVDPPGTWSHPSWQSLGFSIADSHRYSYELITNGNAFTIRALGDLDGDGQFSTFERTGEVTSTGEIIGPRRPTTNNELE